jgi:N-dimethylarginine dimethylaminohydrolase
MCRPAYFDAVPSIDPQRAALQWQRLHDLYVELGHTVELIRAVSGLPDMVFTASGATVLDGRALVARFLHDERAAESVAYLDWFGSRGFEVRQAAWTNEGESDYLVAGGWLLAGSGFRTDRRSHAESEEFFGRPVIGLTLVDENYYHLDTALAVLDDRTAACYPAAFDAAGMAALAARFPRLIEASRADAEVLGLNAVSDGRHVVLPAQATGLARQIAAAGFEPVPVDTSEFAKAGGGPKCCTLELR